MNDEFYKDKTWEMLFKRMDSQDEILRIIKQDLQNLKDQRVWLSGVVFALTVLGTAGWNWFLAMVQGKK